MFLTNVRQRGETVGLQKGRDQGSRFQGRTKPSPMVDRPTPGSLYVLIIDRLGNGSRSERAGVSDWEGSREDTPMTHPSQETGNVLPLTSSNCVGGPPTKVEVDGQDNGKLDLEVKDKYRLWGTE